VGPRVVAASPSQLQSVDITEGLEETRYKKLPCPGQLEDLQRSAAMTLNMFDGFQCDLTKIFDTDDGSFQVAQNVRLGNTAIPKPDGASYHAVATLLKGPRMFQGVLMQDATVVAGTYVDRFESGLEVRADAQLTKDAAQATLAAQATYSGDDYATMVKAESVQGSSQLSFSYLQSVTPTLALGADMMWMGSYKKLDYGFAARYLWSEAALFAATFKVAEQAATVLYKQRLDERITFYAQLGAHPAPQQQGSTETSLESNVALGYEYHIRMENAGVNPRTGQTEFVPYTTMSVQWHDDMHLDVMLEQLTMGGAGRLKLSASVDHPKSEYKFGVGFEIQY